MDLATNPLREETPVIALARIEQLYPFPAGDLQPLLEGYLKLEEVVWLQEESANMGAWMYMQPRLGKLINGRWPLRYIGRPPNSSPAEGSSAWHAVNQKALVERAYNLESHVLEDIVISSEWT